MIFWYESLSENESGNEKLDFNFFEKIKNFLIKK